MARRSVLLTGLLLPIGLAAASTRREPPPELARHLPQARLQGSGRLTFFALQIYDARLWVGPDFRPARAGSAALAIELEYARKLYGRAIAERSLAEMKLQAEIDAPKAKAWLAQLSTIFPDVDAGDRITGIQLPGEAAIYYLNGRPIGEIRDAEFTALFFGIWLSPKTSEPVLRKALLAGAGGNP